MKKAKAGTLKPRYIFGLGSGRKRSADPERSTNDRIANIASAALFSRNLKRVDYDNSFVQYHPIVQFQAHVNDLSCGKLGAFDGTQNKHSPLIRNYHYSREIARASRLEVNFHTPSASPYLV